MRYLKELEDQQTALSYFETILRYVFSAAKDLTKQDVESIVKNFEETYPRGGEVAMTLADMWREEGLQKGIQQGMEIGGTKALVATALRLLTKKFYTIPAEMKVEIAKLDTITLELLIDDVLGAESLEDIRKYLC